MVEAQTHCCRQNNNKKQFLEEIGAYLKPSGFQPRPTEICTERKTFCKVEMNFGRKYEHRDLHRNNFFLQYRSESFVEINQHRDLQKNKYFLQSRNDFLQKEVSIEICTQKSFCKVKMKCLQKVIIIEISTETYTFCRVDMNVCQKVISLEICTQTNYFAEQKLIVCRK